MTIRVGFLGTGAWSYTHLYWVQQQPDAVVTACYGTNAEKTRRFQQAAGETCRLFASYEEMFPEIDALYVVVPPFAHTGQIEEAIRAGIHVFTEKPLARKLADAQKTVAVAAAHPNVQTQLGYMLRFSRPVEVVGDFVYRRGKPILFTGRYFSNSLHAHWWRDHARSGGQLLEQTIHLIDLACFLFGDPVEVFCSRDNLAHRETEGYTTDDVSAVVIRFANGALGTFSSTNAAIPERWDMEYEVVFERFTMRSTTLDSARCWVTDPNAPEEFSVEPGRGPYRVETEDFFDAIRRRRPTRCPLSEGLVALRVIEAAEESARRRLPVAVEN